MLTCSVNLSCDKGEPCTMEFRTIGVTITDKQGKDVELDDFYVIKIAANDTILSKADNPYQSFEYKGYYVILTDNEMHHTNNKGGNLFNFVGFLNTDKVVDQTYRISHDNCHIKLISGETQVII